MDRKILSLLLKNNNNKTATKKKPKKQFALFYLVCVRMGRNKTFTLCGITTGLISRSEQSKGWAFLIPVTSILTVQSQLLNVTLF